MRPAVGILPFIHFRRNGERCNADQTNHDRCWTQLPPSARPNTFPRTHTNKLDHRVLSVPENVYRTSAEILAYYRLLLKSPRLMAYSRVAVRCPFGVLQKQRLMNRRSTKWFAAFVCAWVVLFAPNSRAFEQKAVTDRTRSLQPARRVNVGRGNRVTQRGARWALCFLP